MFQALTEKWRALRARASQPAPVGHPGHARRGSMWRSTAVAFVLTFLGFVLLLAVPATAQVLAQAPQAAAATTQGGFEINVSSGGDMAGSLKLVMMMTVLALIPALLMTTTCFTRIIIVLSLLRQAMGTQQTPPNQVLIGLSLFLTMFIMAPTLSQIEKDAYQPYVQGEISTEQALEKGAAPLRTFMLKQTREKDLGLFFQLADRPKPRVAEDVPMMVLAPAFILSELKTAFEIGFLIYVPFLVLDMLVASVLMSMGMMMLPPVVISLPFKLLLFILIDGWYMVVGTLIQSFG
jgi:flagellar biosynthetic protein FliP